MPGISHDDFHRLPIEFDEGVLIERGDDGGQVSLEKGFQVAVRMLPVRMSSSFHGFPCSRCEW